VLLLVVQYRSGAARWSAPTTFAIISIVVSTIHLSFGQVGWFFRYEDYMVALLGVALIIQITDVLTRVRASGRATQILWTIALAFVLVSVGVGARRAWLAYESTPRAMANVHEQMYQMAQFVKANPQYDSIAIGDLGAISYYNDDVRILDLEGLAERGVPLAHLGRFNSTAADIKQRAKKDGSQIAIVFPDYFNLPSDWIEVGRWTIQSNLVTFGTTVKFYAIPPTDPAALAAALARYSSEKLPPTVSGGIRQF
jgi:hypothetical protein